MNLALTISAFSLACCACLSSSQSIPEQTLARFIEQMRTDAPSYGDISQDLFTDGLMVKLTNDQYYTMLLDAIKESSQTAHSTEILSYTDGIERGLELYRIDDDVEDVYIILFKDEHETTIDVSYCLMDADRISSLSVLRKGNIVIGWI